MNFCEQLRSLSRWERGPIGAESQTPVLASVRSYQTSPTKYLLCDDIISKTPDRDASQAHDFWHVLLSPPVRVCNFESTCSFRWPAVYDSYGRVSSKVGALKLFAKCKFEIPMPPGVSHGVRRGQILACWFHSYLMCSLFAVSCPRLVGPCRKSPTDGSDMT